MRGVMGYRTTRRADQDTIDIYARGAADFGADRAERYHQGLLAAFDLLAENPRTWPASGRSSVRR